jgi:GMP synthase (glutamine-hydrolysing)
VSSQVDWHALFAIARRIPSEVAAVSRTCFMWGDAVGADTPGVADVTPTYCDQPTMEQLRAADAVVSSLMLENDLQHSLSQVPVVLFPAAFGAAGNRSIALRPFITRDFMTGKPAVPGEELPFQARPVPRPLLLPS